MTDRSAGARAATASSPLTRLLDAIGDETGPRRTPPVERWNPPYCGDIDMRIAADGSWHYAGSPIGRPALVKLFASILRRDPERHVLVTPVERVGITVEDAPFLAVEMAVDGEGEGRLIAFRTNVDDVVPLGRDHPLRFERDATGGVKPYVLVRGGLWARLTRALTYDLLALGEQRDCHGRSMFGLAAGQMFFEIAATSELEAVA